MSPSLLRAITGLFFLSGAVGLVYEVVWGKYLGAILGHTGVAHAVVLATFMGGLALGNALLGGVADRVKNQLYLYAWLELGVGLLAALSPMSMGLLAKAYVALATSLGLGGGALLTAKIAVAALALLPPTLLMGGTLPALSRFITSSMATMQASIARLYFLNSFGAVAGSLVAGYVWIPAYGLDRALFLGAGINVLVGLAALGLSKRLAAMAPAEPADEAAQPDAPVYGQGQVRAILVAVAVSGFVSLAFEVAWIRLLSLVLGSSTYSFSLMLAAFVGGIANGSWLIHRGKVPGRDPYRQFAWAQWGIALSVLATLPFYEQLPAAMIALREGLPRTDTGFYLYQVVQLASCFVLMLAPATCIGMTLPLASRVVTRAVDEVGAKVGAVFSLNTLGNVTGALMAGLVLLPALGLRGTIVAGVAVNLVLAALVVLAGQRAALMPRLALAIAPLIGFTAYHAVVPGWDMQVLGMGAFRPDVAVRIAQAGGMREAARAREILFLRDDATATIEVGKLRASGEIMVRTNGKVDASSMGDLATQKLLAHVPLMLKPDADRVLVVGLGSGITVGAALTHPVKAVDVVEISPAMIEANRYFAEANGHALDDPRVRVHLDDAAGYMRLNDARYDVVISEPSNPWVAGVGNLFTTEFYEEASRHLKPGGMMVQWFHTYEMDEDTFRLVLRTFADHFPHVSMWQTQSNDVMLVGAHDPATVAPAALAARLGLSTVHGDLAKIGISRPSSLLALQIGSDAGVRRLAGDGPLNMQTRPILEYQAPKAFYESKVAGSPFSEDERLKAPVGGSPLWLAQAKAAGAITLGPDDYAEAVAYQERWFPLGAWAAARKMFLETWLRQAPGDERARWASFKLMRQVNEPGQAHALIEALVARHPNNPAYLDAAVDQDYLQFARGYLGGDEAAYARMKTRLVALAKLDPAAAPGVPSRLAAIAFSAGHLADGYGAIDQAAASAPAERRRALWLVAAQAALEANDLHPAANYLQRAMAQDPTYPPALVLAQELLKRTHPSAK